MQQSGHEASPGSHLRVSRLATPDSNSKEQLSSDPDLASAQARFVALIPEYLDGLYWSALRLTRNRTTAEDLVQDVMLKAWRSFHTFQEGTRIRAWLHRILLNAVFDAYRNQTQEPDIVDRDDVDDFYLYRKAREGMAFGEAGNPELLILDQIMETDVRDSLEALPPHFRSAVLLADVHGFSYKEIASILGVPIGTVMSRLSRGRSLLQRWLWEYVRDRYHLRHMQKPAANGSGGLTS